MEYPLDKSRLGYFCYFIYLFFFYFIFFFFLEKSLVFWQSLQFKYTMYARHLQANVDGGQCSLHTQLIHKKGHWSLRLN